MRSHGFVLAVLLVAEAAAAAPFAYVAGSGSISSTITVVDTATDTVVTTVPAFRFTQAVAVSPDGGEVYLASFDDDAIEVLDAFTNTISGSFPGTAGFPVVSGIAINAAATRLYVIGPGFGVVDLTNHTLITELYSPGVINNPAGVTVLPDGSKAYATNVFDGSHTVVLDTATNTLATSLPGTGSRGIDTHPDGSRVYAADNQSFPFGVSVIDTATDTLVTKIDFGFPGPMAVRVHPDGTRVYAVGDGNLTEIDAATNTISNSVPTSKLHFGLDINPAGTKLYLPAYEGSVEVYDADTLAFITSIPVAGEAFSRGRFIGPPIACGDGVHQPTEECDDGNLNNGDCCSSTCQLEICNDANPCTLDACVAPTGCVFSARNTCKTAAKTMLQLKDKSDDSKDKLLWKWIKGQSTDIAEFSDPTDSADYTLCLFAGTTSSTFAAIDVPAGAGWNATGTKGFVYKSETGTPEGITKATLKSSDQDKSKVIFKGNGASLPEPPALDMLATPVLVQLINDETTSCWEATYQSADVLKQDEGQFKAKTEN